MLRRSDTDFKPNSLYNFVQIEYFQQPVMAKTAWYWIFYTDSLSYEVMSVGEAQIQCVAYDKVYHHNEDDNLPEPYIFSQLSLRELILRGI